MRPHHPRSTPRRAPAGVVAVALLTLAAALGPVPASAAPTAEPTPAVTATATPTPTPEASTSAPTASATPTATPEPSTSPTPSATPSASASPAPSASADAPGASPQPVPAPRRVGRTVAGPAPAVPALLRRAAAGDRLDRAAPAAAVEVDPRYEVVVLSTCATADEPGLVNVRAVERGDGFDEALTFELTLGGQVVAAGPLDLGSELGVDVTELAADDYRLTTTVAGEAGPSTEADVYVTRCLTPVVDCTGATFTNPAENPAVGVVFGPAGAGEEDAVDGVVFVPPGASRTVRVAYPEIAWAAFSGGGLTDEEDDPDEDEDEPVALVGDGVLETPDGCPPRPRAVTGQVGCVRGSGSARLELDVVPGPVRSFVYQVTDARGRVVAEDRVDVDGEESTAVTERLPGRGRYTFALYLESNQVPYETVDLRVLDCLDVDVTCQAVVLTNPARNPEVELFSGAPGQVEPGFATLAPGAEERIRWTQRDFRWVADATDPDGITESAGDGELTVPQDCVSGTGGGAAPVAAPVHRPGLADTGAPGGVLAALAGALGLTAAGALLLARRRRS
ncbi:hypothetical protein ACFFOM_13560 [Microlunatus capsulatus]|uniref:Gram-positive cocci surface proteins LPxTG domain-containing protein n=1 Tax=Microlunatus capsulatus TaxID=99117 RepID=A0ABS4Z854_9ACTN|nr:hypothetical protein [Microlunatus capsulatus]MBP2417228.1 hypothetical protein [Microlunatus capsulatus]